MIRSGSNLQRILLEIIAHVQAHVIASLDLDGAGTHSHAGNGLPLGPVGLQGRSTRATVDGVRGAGVLPVDEEINGNASVVKMAL